MRTLEFFVNVQRITKNPDCDFSGVAAGTKGYMYAKFSFSAEWDGFEKAASFFAEGKEYPVVLDEDDACEIPSEALLGTLFFVGVTGKMNEKILTTNTCAVYQKRRNA